MAIKIPPSEAVRQEIFRLQEVGLEAVSNPLDSLVRLASMFMLQVGLGREMEEFLGRAYYQRQSRCREGWRNGYESKRLKTTRGLLQLLVPQARNTKEPFNSRLLKAVGNSSKGLQEIVTRMYVGGLSTRDMEGLFYEVCGEGIISKSGVSQLSQVTGRGVG